MSKRHALERSFQEALKTEIRWPTKGDKAFNEATNPQDNAVIADDEFTRLVFMTNGYKLAGDCLVSEATDSPRDRDLLVFPILFNYRHFLELSLKYQLATFGRIVGIDSNWKDHDLSVLWRDFLELLDRYGTPDPDHADEVVGDIVVEFAKIDPQSYSNRYPVDRKGVPVPVSQSALDLEQLADKMNAVQNYFTGCDGFLSSCQ